MGPVGMLETVYRWFADMLVAGVSVVPVPAMPSTGGAWDAVLQVVNGATYFVPMSALTFAVAVWLVYLGVWVGLATWRWVRTLGAP